MNADIELEAWRREWQSEAVLPPDLRRHVERQSRWLKIERAMEILVTVTMGGAVLWLAAREPGIAMQVLAAGTWTFIAAAWAFRLTVGRGLGATAAMDTAAFVQLAIRRCRAQMKATVFGAALLVVEVPFLLGWMHQYADPGTPWMAWLAGSPASRFAGLVSAGFFAFLAWHRRRKQAELKWLMGLAGQANGSTY